METCPALSHTFRASVNSGVSLVNTTRMVAIFFLTVAWMTSAGAQSSINRSKPPPMMPFPEQEQVEAEPEDQQRDARGSSGGVASRIQCTIAEIAILPDRMHITCKERSGQYYALALDDRPFVDHVLDVARDAMIAGRRVMILVDPARPDNPSGCRKDDCYRIQAIALH